MTARVKYPKDLGTEGRRLWRAIAGEFELEVWEEQQLHALCTQADRLAILREELQNCESTTVNAKGERVSEPRIVELRLLTAAFQRGLLSLGIRSGVVDEDADGETPRMPRGSYRGTYGKAETRLRSVK